jgi:hypothetical protein
MTSPLTALGSLAGKAGGPLMLVPIAAGLVIGSILVYPAIRGALPEGTVPAGGVAVYGCPGVGQPLAHINRGERVLLTGRTEDGSWYEVHYAGPEPARVWVEAPPFRIEGEPMSLPVVRCRLDMLARSFPAGATLTPIGAPPSPSPSASVPASVEPSASASAPPATQPPTTPSPRTPPPDTEPPRTAPPSVGPSDPPGDETGPEITDLRAQPRLIQVPGGGLRCDDTATVQVSVTDSSGVATVDLEWDPPGPAPVTGSRMTPAGGGQYQGQITATETWTEGDPPYTVVASDRVGNSNRASGSLHAVYCDQTPPMVSSLDYEPDIFVCSSPTVSFAASAEDPSGVDVILHWTPPGLEPTSGTMDRVRDGRYRLAVTLTRITGPDQVDFRLVVTDGAGNVNDSQTASVPVSGAICERPAMSVDREADAEALRLPGVSH